MNIIKCISLLVLITFGLSSCEKDDINQLALDENKPLELKSQTLSKVAASDIGVGVGGTVISMTGTKVLSPGKYVIILDMSETSYWTYGFSSVEHINSPLSEGNLYYRVVKWKDNSFSADEYKLFVSPQNVPKGSYKTYSTTTKKVRVDAPSSGGNWNKLQLELIVTDGNVKVSWSSFNKSPW